MRRRRSFRPVAGAKAHVRSSPHITAVRVLRPPPRPRTPPRTAIPPSPVHGTPGHPATHIPWAFPRGPQPAAADGRSSHRFHFIPPDRGRDRAENGIGEGRAQSPDRRSPDHLPVPPTVPPMGGRSARDHHRESCDTGTGFPSPGPAVGGDARVGRGVGAGFVWRGRVVGGDAGVGRGVGAGFVWRGRVVGGDARAAPAPAQGCRRVDRRRHRVAVAWTGAGGGRTRPASRLPRTRTPCPLGSGPARRYAARSSPSAVGPAIVRALPDRAPSGSRHRGRPVAAFSR
ncbi:hypothetical protein HNP84_009154 [Thermocatellispora tengchongensis]|uniref:Uncharacterized protein n=1 Tax=Thermocatellispora tengchongensis TaxID=1073253 RepID=A0A840PNN8_9ACTN|nr:hypothetical protein [Thermocatellispora tengchongensis]